MVLECDDVERVCLFIVPIVGKAEFKEKLMNTL